MVSSVWQLKKSNEISIKRRKIQHQAEMLQPGCVSQELLTGKEKLFSNFRNGNSTPKQNPIFIVFKSSLLEGDI